jgi:phage gp29-like protein
VVLARNLRQEIATSRRNVVHPVYGGDRLYPQDETLIHEGGRGFLAYDIYTEIAKDCHAYAVLQKRFMAVVGREWEVLPGQRRGSSSTRQEKKAADMLKAQLEGLSVRSEIVEDRETTLTTAGNFDEVCWNLLWAIHYGWQPAELIWDQDGSEAFVSEAIAKDLRRFVMVVGQRGFKLRMLDITGNLVEGVPLPHRKFIVHRFASVPTEDPYGLGLGTRLFYPTFFKRQDIKFWLQFVDKFASPTAVAKYPRGASDADKKEYLAMLDAIATDAGIAIPADVIVEFLESERASALNTYKDLAAFCDGEISKAVLGETGTTDQQGSGGSRARDQVGDGVRIEVAKADADLLSATLNRSLCRWVSELNFGPDVAPPMIWRKFPELAEKEDLNARATRDNTIASASGRTITEKYWVDTYGVEFEPKQPAQDPNAPPDLSGAFGPPPGAAPDASPPPNGATPDATAPPADAAALDAPPALNLEEQLCKPCTVEHPGDAAESSTPWTVGDASNLSEPAETPAVETTTQQLTQSAIAQSQQPVEDWFEKVRGLLDGAASLEEVRDRLYELYKDLPGADFAEAVAQAMQVAELAGRWEVLNPEPVVNLSEDIADFARLKMAGNTKQRKNCTKGWSCGYTCLGKDKKNCKSPLQGQVAKYADWLEQQAVGLSTMGAKPALNLDPQSFEEFISNGRQIVGEEFFAATKDAIAQYKQLDARYESARDGKYYEALVDYQFSKPEYGRVINAREAALTGKSQLRKDYIAAKIDRAEYKKQTEKFDRDLKSLDVEWNALRARLQDEFETTQPELVDIAKERARLDQIGMDLRDRLLKSSTVSEAEAKELAAKVKIPRASEKRDPELRGEVANLIRLSNGAAAETLKEIKIISGRAYSQKSNGLVAVRTGARRALYHEIGHQIEDSQGLFALTASRWISSRAEGQVTRLSNLTKGRYRSDEVAFPDKFIDPYVGKLYKSGSTEVISMGVETFASPRAMLNLASADPDHFAYTVGVLQTPRNK